MQAIAAVTVKLRNMMPSFGQVASIAAEIQFQVMALAKFAGTGLPSTRPPHAVYPNTRLKIVSTCLVW
jgi:hypothetical protein